MAYDVPTDIAESLGRYVLEGIPPGGFLRAVLANDLMGAVGRADRVNRYYLFEICIFIENSLNPACRGSYDAVQSWIDQGGAVGRVAAKPRRETQ